MKNLNLAYIIDDDEITIYLADNIMKKVDFCEKVEKFTNGMDAINRLKFALELNENVPDVILFDLNMPGMDGWEFIEEYKKLNTNRSNPAQIVMLTTSPNPDDEQKAKQINEVIAFKRKPLAQSVIVDILKEHFATHM